MDGIKCFGEAILQLGDDSGGGVYGIALWWSFVVAGKTRRAKKYESGAATRGLQDTYLGTYLSRYRGLAEHWVVTLK